MIHNKYMESIQQETLELAKKGSHDAFAKIYSHYYPICFGFFRSRILNTNSASDMTQETFLRAYTAISRFDITRRFSSWIMGICYNVLREYVRRERGRREVKWAELCLEVAATIDDESVYLDMIPHVPGCISDLAPETESVLRAHYFEGRKLGDIAEELKKSLSAVKMTLFRARRAIKTCVQRKLERIRK